MYKQYKFLDGTVVNNAIIYTIDNATIPFDPANKDYANFKAQILAETAQLQDADGNTMTAAEAKSYIATLP